MEIGMARISIDGREFEVPEGRNLLHACLSLGFDLPYFCWHPAMGSVGACRQCAVRVFKDDSDSRGRIVMACMTAATDGLRVSIDDVEARLFRANVVGWLMLNHPHDCPICDEGGECHLQDMTVMTGHDYRETRFAKRTYENQDLGPFVAHEMNRCIQCYRCVRFYRDCAGGRDLDAFGAHDHVFFGRAADGPLESEFSGNLVEVCPTGVFTDRTFARHFARKWDLTTAPSVCVHCSIGCNTIPGAREGTLRRIRNRYHADINGYFLCDRGRFGYEYVNSTDRLLVPLVRGEVSSPVAAVTEAARLLSEANGIVGIGSPRASVETLFALREIVGDAGLCAGVSAQELAAERATVDALRGPAPAASLRDVRAADAVLLLGEDPTSTAPMLALAIRAAVRVKPHADAHSAGIPEWHDAAVRAYAGNAAGPLFIATPAPTRLDDIATQRIAAAPADVARFGFAVASELGAPVPPEHLNRDMRDAARRAAHELRSAERPVVIAGSGAGEPAVVAAAAAVAWRLHDIGVDARLCVTALECDAIGSGLLGGTSLEDALSSIRSGAADTLLIAENDLYRRADPATVEELLGGVRAVIVLDALHTPTASRADVALPAATFAESTGTLINHEGRAQRFFAAMPKPADVRESWRWLAAIGQEGERPGQTAEGAEPAWDDEDAVLEAIAQALPELAGVCEAAPGAAWRSPDGRQVARDAFRHAGRTAEHAAEDVREHAPATDPDSPLAFTMEGYTGQVPPALVPRYHAAGWNSVQALNKFQQEVGGELVGGAAGVRLIQPGAGPARYPINVPPAFQSREGEWLLIPVYHAFGSEELSSRCAGVVSLAPLPYLGISSADATATGLRTGDTVRVQTARGSGLLPLTVIDGLARGVAALPVALSGMSAALRAGDWARIEREAEGVRGS
jgi:NADH-quinone oxidoreductase subunit G